MSWICGKSPQLIDARTTRASEWAATGVRVDSGEGKWGILDLAHKGWSDSGLRPPQDDQPLAGFEELAMPLFDSLYNFARWLAHNSNDAEDLVQETYLKALRSFASFQPGTNFRAWMFQILRNTFLSSCSTLERRMTVAMDSEEDGPELAG
jgi:hypothetical protein